MTSVEKKVFKQLTRYLDFDKFQPEHEEARIKLCLLHRSFLEALLQDEPVKKVVQAPKKKEAELPVASKKKPKKVEPEVEVPETKRRKNDAEVGKPVSAKKVKIGTDTKKKSPAEAKASSKKTKKAN